MALNVRPACRFFTSIVLAWVTKSYVIISRDISFQFHGSVLCVACRSFLTRFCWFLVVSDGIKLLNLKRVKQLSEKRTEYSVISCNGLKIWPVSLHKVYPLSVISLIAWEYTRRNSTTISMVGTADLSWATSRTSLTGSHFAIASDYGNVQACGSMCKPRDVTKNRYVALTTVTWPYSRSKHLPIKIFSWR